MEKISGFDLKGLGLDNDEAIRFVHDINDFIEQEDIRGVITYLIDNGSLSISERDKIEELEELVNTLEEDNSLLEDNNYSLEDKLDDMYAEECDMNEEIHRLQELLNSHNIDY